MTYPSSAVVGLGMENSLHLKKKNNQQIRNNFFFLLNDLISTLLVYQLYNVFFKTLSVNRAVVNNAQKHE